MLPVIGSDLFRLAYDDFVPDSYGEPHVGIPPFRQDRGSQQSPAILCPSFVKALAPQFAS